MGDGGGGVGTRQVRRYMGSLNGSNSGSLEWALKGGGGQGDWSTLEPKANISASEKVVTYKTRKKGTA